MSGVRGSALWKEKNKWIASFKLCILGIIIIIVIVINIATQKFYIML